jgi:hypothetical protein
MAYTILLCYNWDMKDAEKVELARLKNLEAVKKSRAKRSLADPEWQARQAREWRAKNPEKIKAIKRAYYLRHKERLKAKAYAYRKTRPEHFLTYNREYQRKHRAKFTEARRHRRYGLTLGQIEAMLESQQHACAICRRAKPAIKKLCVDHCHSSHVVRGILCDGCNVGLGAFSDNPERLAAAVNYLKRFNP